MIYRVRRAAGSSSLRNDPILWTVGALAIGWIIAAGLWTLLTPWIAAGVIVLVGVGLVIRARHLDRSERGDTENDTRVTETPDAKGSLPAPSRPSPRHRKDRS